MLTTGRNLLALTPQQITYCKRAWRILCGSHEQTLNCDEASQHGSRTRFDEIRQIVYLGADAEPGEGLDANSRMSVLACLAHELAHVQRFCAGYRRPTRLPDVLIDEAETSLRASFISVLRMKDREDLVEDARDRLIHWLGIRHESNVEKRKGPEHED